MTETIFEPAWRRADPKLENHAKEFWARLKILPANVSADDRVKELAVVAYSNERIVGVSTATIDFIPQFKSNMTLFRCACETALRRTPLSEQITDYTRRLLETWSEENPDERVMGMMVIVESPQLVRNYPSVFGPASLNFAGFSERGFPLRVAWFKHATIPLPRGDAAS